MIPVNACHLLFTGIRGHGRHALVPLMILAEWSHGISCCERDICGTRWRVVPHPETACVSLLQLVAGKPAVRAKVNTSIYMNEMTTLPAVYFLTVIQKRLILANFDS